MSEDTPRFHTAEAALAYEQGKRDALRDVADELSDWVDHPGCDIPDWHNGMIAAVEMVQGMAEQAEK